MFIITQAAILLLVAPTLFPALNLVFLHRNLRLVRQDRAVWQGRLHGPVQPLLEFLAGKPVADLSIVRPDLESLFRSFYKDEVKKT